MYKNAQSTFDTNAYWMLKKGQLPMTSSPIKLLRGTVDVLILKTLSWGPLHGYGVSKSIRETSSELLQVDEGALYPALRRLEAKGWLESHWGETETQREAKFYQLTASGRRQLTSELNTWQRYVDAMASVLYQEQPNY